MKIRLKQKGKYPPKLTKTFLIVSCLLGVILVLLVQLTIDTWSYVVSNKGNYVDHEAKQDIQNYLHSFISMEATEVDKSPLDASSSFQDDRPPHCTLDQLKTVRRQLRPETCFGTIEDPFLQRCSLTQETKCPDTSNYLDEYYNELQMEYLEKLQQQQLRQPNNNDNVHVEPFVGLSVGCNKGFDALNTLRRGTFDASLSKDDWRMEMAKDGILHQSVCAQNVTLPFQVHPNMIAHQPRKGTVHCFEPVPATVKKLQSASINLGYDAKGYKVIHAAVSNETGTEYFQSKAKPGHENGGLDNCRRDVGNVDCDIQVQVLTLETYAKEHLIGGNDSPIHILQIDVEGYDADVLYGAGEDFLKRVEYLEFEYNWMGSWKNQHLYDVIDMLDGIGLTCYWAGNQILWRVTGCWQLYFDVHTWSNLACANRRRVPTLAAKMENVFQKQLLVDDMEGTKNKKRAKPSWIKHEILSLDPIMMTSRYLSPEAIERAKIRKRIKELKKNAKKQG